MKLSELNCEIKSVVASCPGGVIFCIVNPALRTTSYRLTIGDACFDSCDIGWILDMYNKVEGKEMSEKQEMNEYYTKDNGHANTCRCDECRPRDCHTCGRPEEGQVCSMKPADTDTCLKNPSRPFWKPVYQESAVRTEPMPQGEGEMVLDAVMTDLRLRAEVGLKKYGTPLRAHNGRDALVDAYQEALDLVMYLKQMLLEREIKQNHS